MHVMFRMFVPHDKRKIRPLQLSLRSRFYGRDVGKPFYLWGSCYDLRGQAAQAIFSFC